MQTHVSAAKQAAKKAGRILKKHFGDQHRIRFKEDSSIVTEIDLASNEAILKILKEHFSNHTFLSEELPGALQQKIDDRPTWVIDPLDGTSNYVAGIPLFGITIALVENREAKFGLIYDPLHDEMFVAEKGRGAVMNGEPIHVSAQMVTRGGMLFAGRGDKKQSRDRHANIIAALERETTYFRRLGSAAIMLASVAVGRADSVILTSAKTPWDTIAGALLVREAGGKITDYCGDAWTHESEDLVATNGQIHDQLIAITRLQEESCV